jgi:hypothetical protein
VATNINSLAEADIIKLIGDPARLDAELPEFSRDTRVLSSKRAKLVETYAQRWVAIYQGEVKADDDDLNHLLEKADKLGLPRDKVVMRYIDRNVKRMIL